MKHPLLRNLILLSAVVLTGLVLVNCYRVGDWRTASREPAGIAPDPLVTCRDFMGSVDSEIGLPQNAVDRAAVAQIRSVVEPKDPSVVTLADPQPAVAVHLKAEGAVHPRLCTAGGMGTKTGLPEDGLGGGAVDVCVGGTEAKHAVV